MILVLMLGAVALALLQFIVILCTAAKNRSLSAGSAEDRPGG